MSVVEGRAGDLVSILDAGRLEMTCGMSSIASRMLGSDASTSTSLSPDLILILTLLLSTGIGNHDKWDIVI
jgi:hypothetical protein